MVSNLMKMKKFVSIIALFFATTVFVYAQQDARQVNRVSKIMANIEKACNLSNEQASKVLPVVQFFVKTSFENRKQYANDKNALQAARKTTRQNFKESMAKVLTPDQMKQLEQYMKDRKGAGGNKANGKNAGQ